MPAALKIEEITDTPQGTAVARHYATGEGVRVEWNGGTITAVTPVGADALPADAPWIAPALVDLQVNGYGGVDFQVDASAEREALLRATRALHRDGCSRYLLTLITRQWDDLLAHLARVKAVRDGDPELRRAIFGWHIEGPFISEAPGFIGAHDPEAVCNPTPEAMEQLKAIVGDDPTLLTLAAERPGTPAAVARATQLGIRISIGHSNASRAEIDAATQAGAQGYTHLGNGCPQQLDRHDNILWRVLDQSGLRAGVIPDTHHVTPALFRLFHQLLPRESVYWTTDAMAGAGAPPGLYTIGRLAIEVGEDRIARQPGRQNFAGSVVEPIEAIRRGAAMLGTRWNNVWDHFSTIPARWLGLPCGLEPGAQATFCFLRDEES